MLKRIKRRLSAIGLSVALFLYPLTSVASKVYASQKRQTQQQQQIQQVGVYGINPEEYLRDYEVRTIYEYLDLNKKIKEHESKWLDTKELSNKRNSLEEKVEKILERQVKSVFNEMYPTESKGDGFAIDLTDTPAIMTIAKRDGEEVYQKVYSRSFSEKTLEKLEDLAEFLGPDAVKKLEEEFEKKSNIASIKVGRKEYRFDRLNDEDRKKLNEFLEEQRKKGSKMDLSGLHKWEIEYHMPEKELIEKIDRLIEQAKKDNDGKLERKYRAFASSLEGMGDITENNALLNRHINLNRIMRSVGHEYGHFLYTDSPLQANMEGEQFALVETICDLLGDKSSLGYAQKYIKEHPEKYKEYLGSVNELKRRSEIGRDLIIQTDKLMLAGKIDLAEKLMDEAAKKMGIQEINQANIALVKKYSGIDYIHLELSHMFEELGPDDFIKTTKYITNFKESSDAYMSMQEVNKMSKDELIQNYLENQQSTRELIKKEVEKVAPLYPDLRLVKPENVINLIPLKWELREKLIKKELLLHKLDKELSEKGLAEVIKLAE